MKKIFTLVIVLSVLSIIGCAPQNKTQKGAAYGTAGGAAAGAILGQVIGGDTEATLLGAGIGAAIGGLTGAGIGHMMDEQERKLQQALAASNAASVYREGNLIGITFKGDVTFATNSSIINAGLYPEVERIANIMSQYPQTNIQIEGHTDSTGSESHNMELSRRRAESVKNLLIQRGVSVSRIQVLAFGESMPIASNSTEAGRQRNRRVEIKIIPNA